MTCDEYKDWAAAVVDGIDGPEASRARQHASGCAACRAEHERQVAVRTLLRSRSVLPEAPIGLRTRILASIDDEASVVAASNGWRDLRRLFGFGALAAAAGLAALLLLRPSGGDFDPLIRHYDLAAAGKLDLGFATDAPAALEQFYARHATERIPAHVIDLTSAGFHLVGGALADFPRRRARLSVYSDGRDWIVCDYQFARGFPMELPSDGQSVFFERGGMSFCAHRVGDDVCLLATRMPLQAFRRRLGGETAVG